MNNELMEQCRKEAEEWAVSKVGKKLKLNTVDERVREIIIERNDQSIQGYAAALYAERSKRRELTDEEIERLGAEHEASLIEFGQDPHISNIERIAFETGLVQSRYYLAPAAGLTVERAEQAVKEWCLDWCERVAPDATDWNDLHARLTEAAKH